jgi:hypothetical protein
MDECLARDFQRVCVSFNRRLNEVFLERLQGNNTTSAATVLRDEFDGTALFGGARMLCPAAPPLISDPSFVDANSKRRVSFGQGRTTVPAAVWSGTRQGLRSQSSKIVHSGEPFFSFIAGNKYRLIARVNYFTRRTRNTTKGACIMRFIRETDSLMARQSSSFLT